MWENWAAELGGLCILLDSIPSLPPYEPQERCGIGEDCLWDWLEECTAPTSRSRTAPCLFQVTGLRHSREGWGQARICTAPSAIWVFPDMNLDPCSLLPRGNSLGTGRLLTLSQIPLPGGQVMGDANRLSFPWLIGYYSALTFTEFVFMVFFFFAVISALRNLRH